MLFQSKGFCRQKTTGLRSNMTDQTTRLDPRSPNGLWLPQGWGFVAFFCMGKRQERLDDNTSDWNRNTWKLESSVFKQKYFEDEMCKFMKFAYELWISQLGKVSLGPSLANSYITRRSGRFPEETLENFRGLAIFTLCEGLPYWTYLPLWDRGWGCDTLPGYRMWDSDL